MGSVRVGAQGGGLTVQSAGALMELKCKIVSPFLQVQHLQITFYEGRSEAEREEREAKKKREKKCRLMIGAACAAEATLCISKNIV